MALEKYREKRNFKKTPEPKGALRSGKKKPLIFVVQKHRASRLHYDLRLELEGVLKSWAVPKGPTLDPDEKKLAMMVEDHPLDYRNFEGNIPEGNYGAGNVMIWDEGAYHARGSADGKESERLLREGLDKGHISFVLNGKKLKGEFALVKIRTARDNSWLLIKKRDEFARKDAGEDDRSVATGRTMDEIAREEKGKQEEAPAPNLRRVDLHGAASAEMPGSVRPMLATLVEEPFDREGWLFEVKWDGCRALAEIRGGIVRLYSRNDKTLNEKFSPIVESLKTLHYTALFDGEIVILDETGRADFQLLQNYLRTERGTLVYYVFDLLYFRGHDLRELPLRRRRYILEQVLPENLPHVRISEHIENTGIPLFRAVAENRIEGIVAKNGSSPYRAGVRGHDWLKIKTTLQQEAVIGGFTEPRRGRKHFGALILGVYEDGDLVYIGHSGGGFTNGGLREMRARLDPLRTPQSPFKVPPKPNEKVTWVKPELVCEVRFSEWTSEGLMRHPIFVGLREDLNPEEVVREKPEETPAVLKKPLFRVAKDEKKIEIINGRRLELTNLDKVFWPDEGITKGDLINYYRDVAPVLLPYLIDRPESLHRFPDGINSESFFQKNTDLKTPDWIKTVPVHSDAEGRVIKYLLCQDEATLVYLANLGCIEINPWNARYQAPDNPDYLALDIDPLEIDFSYVIRAAAETHRLLEEAEITACCKTSGATGLHVFIPLGARYATEQVQQFAQLINLIVNRRIPDFTSLERVPARRRGKVYLDFLQNRKGQTMASVYSIRPQTGATASAPLLWAEVNQRLHPSQFTIKNMRQRIDKKGDLWKGVIGPGIDMPRVLERLAEIEGKPEKKQSPRRKHGLSRRSNLFPEGDFR